MPRTKPPLPLQSKKYATITPPKPKKNTLIQSTPHKPPTNLPLHLFNPSPTRHHGTRRSTNRGPIIRQTLNKRRGQGPLQRRIIARHFAHLLIVILQMLRSDRTGGIRPLIRRPARKRVAGAFAAVVVRRRGEVADVWD